MKKSKILLVIILNLLSANILFAQDFAATATLNSVPKSGFYKIYITPQLSKHLNYDLSDFRINDSKGEQVQYIFSDKRSFFSSLNFLEFPIVSNELNQKRNTILIVENKSNLQKEFTEILLFFNNASVSRNAKISGSNNKINWYIIENSVNISNENESVESYFVNRILMPSSNYKYFKIEIDNQKEDPYNIFKAGSHIANMIREKNSFIQNPIIEFKQKDSSDKKSYITLFNTNSFFIDKVGLYFSGQKLFDRNLSIYLPKSIEYNRNFTQLQQSINISSSKKNIFEINKIKEHKIDFVIENNDNTALKLDSITTFQILSYVITYLEQGKQYQILAQNKLAQKPNYDLEKFKDSIPTIIESIGFGEIKTIGKTKPVEKQKNNYWIWIAIAAAILVMGLLTKSLLADMKKKNL